MEPTTPDAIEPPATVLLLADSYTDSDACVDLRTAVTPRAEILVRFAGDPMGRHTGPETDRPNQLGLVSVGDVLRSATTDNEASGPSAVDVRAIEEPSDVAGIGIAISELCERWSNETGVVDSCGEESTHNDGNERCGLDEEGSEGEDVHKDEHEEESEGEDVHKDECEEESEGEDVHKDECEEVDVKGRNRTDFDRPLKYNSSEEEPGTETIVCCFHSLDALLNTVSLETAFRFAHVTATRLSAVGAHAHFHLDPTKHDEEVINTFETVFDATVCDRGLRDVGTEATDRDVARRLSARSKADENRPVAEPVDPKSEASDEDVKRTLEDS